jgi:hypothetical protein
MEKVLEPLHVALTLCECSYRLEQMHGLKFKCSSRRIFLTEFCEQATNAQELQTSGAKII